MGEADHFLKSLLYNQIPLTAFFNRRTVLAFFALFVGFILVTFVIPFFALIRNRKPLEVTIQLTIALAFFFLATLCATPLIKCFGSKPITFISLALATGACFLLSKGSSDKDLTVNADDNTLTKMIKAAVSFLDGAIIGYLLICIAIAFLTVASLDEVLQGTENTLLRTKFVEASNLHLFVESAFMVLAIIQVAHVLGPIIGGLINTGSGMSLTCIYMGIFGAASLLIYVIFAIYVYCTVH